MVQEGADQIARGSDLIAGILDQMRQRVLTGSWSIPEVSDVVQVQAQLGGVHIERVPMPSVCSSSRAPCKQRNEDATQST